MTSETKPVAFKQGVPKEQKNGFYGLEEMLMANPQEPLTVIATFRVADIIDKELSGERYPIVEIDHLEPIHGAEAIAAAKAIQLAQYKDRTDKDALPIPEEPKLDLEQPLTEKSGEGFEPGPESPAKLKATK